MNTRRMILATLAVYACAAPAVAQDKRVEASVIFGYTFSDGVSGDSVRASNGQLYDRVDPKDSFKWGLDIGALVNDNMQVGFLFGQQPTTLTIGGTATTDVGDLTITTYHGYFGYNFGEADARIRPYLMGGLGATNFGSVEFTTLTGVQLTTDSGTQFSSTWGAGVKVFPRPNVGVRFGVQWTPTYIKSDAEGWWCDPYWGCYVVSDPQYSNQWDLSGGIAFRF
jgi:opacity protein-like surface antigen